MAWIVHIAGFLVAAFVLPACARDVVPPEVVAESMVNRIKEYSLVPVDLERCRKEIIELLARGRSAANVSCVDDWSQYLPPGVAQASLARLSGTAGGELVATDLPGGVGLIRITSFTQAVRDDFVKALKRFADRNGAGSIVIDLRGNGGGISETALHMLHWFAPKPDSLMVTYRYARKEESWRANAYGWSESGKYKHMRVAIVVDKLTASSSEMFIGTMREWGKESGLVTIIGETTFGKGVGQDFSLLADGGYAKITSFEFLVGERRVSIHGRGIVPDVALPTSPSQRAVPEEDPAIERALAFLKSAETG